ncbi:hypothetical protein TW82_11660 [Pseudoalteromonas fuliginea]|nr:hypothetical protein TW82_11660 [Pseudoalteromonas fuliginea]
MLFLLAFFAIIRMGVILITWISQVLKPSLYTCHGFETPLTRHNLTNTAVLHGLRWRCKPRQSDLIFIGAISALQDHDNPYGLHNSLCTLRQSCSCDAILITEKQLLIPHSAKDATLDTGG